LHQLGQLNSIKKFPKRKNFENRKNTIENATQMKTLAFCLDISSFKENKQMMINESFSTSAKKLFT
jgi:hypothetical protein